MALSIGDNFQYQGKKPNFARDSFPTLESLKNVSDTIMDDGHISYCEEDGNTYKYSSSNSADPVTGKWRLFGGGITYYSVPAITEDYMVTSNPSRTNEVIYYIEIGEDVHKVTGDSTIKWQDGVSPVTEANSTVVVSVLNNLAVWGIFK